MTRGPKTNRNASTPGRLGVPSPPSVLIVAKQSDLRAFLRASLERWYRVAETPSGSEAVQHLEHCPPQALIVGLIDPSEEHELAEALHDREDPPVLKLWSSKPPEGWVDATLRHPFMRIDLLRAVDRLLHAEGGPRSSAPTSTVNGSDAEVTARSRPPAS